MGKNIIAQTNLDEKESGSSRHHTNDFKNGPYCSSASTFHKDLNHKKAQLIPYTMDLHTKVV